MSNAGCKTIILHARRAILKGLSPKENLNIPKLNYPMVNQIKQENPNLEIIINGGIDTIADCHQHLTHVDGVMLGRSFINLPIFWLM